MGVIFPGVAALKACSERSRREPLFHGGTHDLNYHVKHQKDRNSISSSSAMCATSADRASYSSETCSWLLFARKNSFEDALSISLSKPEVGSRLLEPANLSIALRDNPKSRSPFHSLEFTICKTRR